MRPTIRDIAKRLNLSITAVSRALNGYSDIGENTRKLILDTAHEMGYIPNRAARQLRRQRSEAIGYIIPTDHAGFSDPFFSEFIAGLGDEVSSHNYDLLVATAGPGSPEEISIYQRWIQAGKVDGMVINRVRLTDWRIQFLVDLHVPFVCLERPTSPHPFTGIEVDSDTGLSELIAHLVNLGHSRIAYIGANSDLVINQKRQAGYVRSLHNLGIKPDPALVTHASLTLDGGYQAAGLLLDQALPPTAIVCINDLVAMGAMHAVHQKKFKVGRDIAITGFDGIPDTAHTQPPLTTLSQPVYKIARQLAAMLIASLNGNAEEANQVVVCPVLLIRASTTG